MRTRRLGAWVLSLTVGVCALAASWPAAAAGPYRGRVVDAETKEPLVGAAIVMYWLIELRYPGHPWRFGDAEEAVTDANGEFAIGEHPPRTFNPLEHVDGPYLIIFQPGYGYFPMSHVAPRPRAGWPVVVEMMKRERVAIELPKLKSRKERVAVAEEVDPLAVPREKIPYFYRLLKSEDRRLFGAQ